MARHEVRPGSEPAFEVWTAGIAAACSQFPGYMETQVIRPMGKAGNQFVSIFRFDSYKHLDAWMTSEEHTAWLAKTGEFSDEPVQVDYHSLEFWFSPRQSDGRVPSKHRMAIVTFAVIWPLVHFVPAQVGALLGEPPLLVEAASVGLIVLLMTYVLMPTITPRIPWLYPKP
ncbi:antibiotic biosynthesis monooxygenase [Planctomycetota bacterium]|nr:antibiotic biosynthesis monooxygenase [Planctomycetota bacterium]